MKILPSPNNNLEYKPALDGLRAVACLLVISFHAALQVLRLDMGWVGVNLFFILSGFLITRILVANKYQALPSYLKQFYIKRVSRIFPWYFFYLTSIFLSLFIGINQFGAKDQLLNEAFSELKNNYPFLATFTYNLSPIVNYLGGSDYGSSSLTGHLWSLSVEMQFYFIFPLFVYYTPKKALKKLLLIVIFLIPVLRLIAVIVLKSTTKDLFWIGYVLYESSIFQLDTLCVGACLALFDCNHLAANVRGYLSVSIGTVVLVGFIHYRYLNHCGLPLSISSLGFDIPVNHPLLVSPSKIINNRYFYTIPLINLNIFLLMLMIIKVNVRLRLFEIPVLVKFGRISYEVYLFHLAALYLISHF